MDVAGGVNLDQDATRVVLLSKALPAVLESYDLHASDLISFDQKELVIVFSADGYNASGTIEVEQANVRIMNLTRLHRAPHSSIPLCMGAFKEKQVTVEALMQPVTTDNESLVENGVSFRCLGLECRACKAGIKRENGSHVVLSRILISADMKWIHDAMGIKHCCCPFCMKNLAWNAIEPFKDVPQDYGLDYLKEATKGYYLALDEFIKSNGAARSAIAKARTAQPLHSRTRVGASTPEPLEATPAEGESTVPANRPVPLEVLEAFRRSPSFIRWQGKHPNNTGPNTLSFIKDLRDICIDPLHMGWARNKEMVDTIISYAVQLEADGKKCIQRTTSCTTGSCA